MRHQTGRVLFCAPSAYTGGGLDVWLETVDVALRSHGFDTTVALMRGRFHDPERYLHHHPHPSTVSVDSSPFAEQRILNLQRLFARERPDLIFVVNVADALYAAAAWKRRHSVRLATCLHSQDAGMIGDVQMCANAVDLASTVTRRVAGVLERHTSIPPERIAHLPTGVPAPLEPVARRRALRHVGYVGRLDQNEKRILDMVETVRRAPGDLMFHIAGDGPEAPVLRRELGEQIVAGRVLMHGQRSREELYREIYPLLDALLLFSPAEAGPMVAWEAMRHGVVPVSSDFAGRAEEAVLIHETNALIFKVGDPGGAAACLHQLRDGDLLQRLSAAAESTLPAEYHDTVANQRWVAAIRKCIASPPAPITAPIALPRSAGRLSRLPLGLHLTAWLRSRRTASSPPPAGPGAEWPHRYREDYDRQA